MRLSLFVIVALIAPFSFSHSIEDFGAIPNDSSVETAYINSKAIEQAFEAA